MRKKFAEYLNADDPMIDSFFAAGDQAEATMTDDKHIQKVMYYTGARYEKISSKPVNYQYTASDIRILENGIHDEKIWG